MRRVEFVLAFNIHESMASPQVFAHGLAAHIEKYIAPFDLVPDRELRVTFKRVGTWREVLRRDVEWES